MYLRTDEFNEAISALEIASEFAGQTVEDNHRWKWVIVSLHNALQGFICLALQGSDGLRVLKDDVASAWVAAHDSGTPMPAEKLDWFPNLYAKIKSGVMAFRINSQIYPGSPEVDKSVKQLNDFRNDFIHFAPKGWSIELAGLPQICANCISVIEFLIEKSGNITWYEDENQVRAKAALEKAKDTFKKMGATCLPV